MSQAVFEVEQGLPFFPIPTRFRHNGGVRSGQIQGYLTGPGDLYGERTVARVVPDDEATELLVPLDDLLD
ncbi:MAG TPA: hypothetical protein VLF41_03505 [Candidatus Nanoarchaeia archaeon]|nr:hypothetical protein [Candidatus Nanoarchaeia archaeon]